MTEWQRMISGRLYNPANKEIEKHHIRGLTLCDKFNRTPLTRWKKKDKLLLKLIPSSEGKDFAVFAPFYCEYGENIYVGRECFVNYNCTFLDVSP